MELVAAIVLIALAVAGAVLAALRISANETARLVVGVILIAVAVACLVVVLDGDTETVGASVPPPAGHAGNAGPVPATTGPVSMGAAGN